MRFILLSTFFLTTLVSYGGYQPADWPGKKMPGFRENKGQITDQYGQVRSDIGFMLAANGVAVFVGNGQLHYQFNKTGNLGMDTSYRLDLELVGANKKAAVIRWEIIPEVSRYVNNGAGRQVLEANAYKKIIYKNVYPHIDWVLYVKAADHAQAGIVKYDFMVHPGGNIKDIRIRYKGATSLRTTAEGGIEAQTPLGNVVEHAPYSYDLQTGNTIRSRFILRGNEINFAANACKGTLVIDPIVDWGTYYGGSGKETCNGMCTDTSGNVYMTGTTTSADNIATTGSYQAVKIASTASMLVKFNKAGVRQWATYYGGSTVVSAADVSCDREGNVYITGFIANTGSFPISTPGSHQPAYGGGSRDAFLAKFKTNGSLEWATYYGGTAVDQAVAVVCDGDNSVYIAGYTTSTNNIASAGSFQPVAAGYRDGFLAKFTRAGVREWATYFGGTSDEFINTAACDVNGNIYIGGKTTSADLGTTGTHQATIPTGEDCILAKFNVLGERQWATYYGGGQVGSSIVKMAIDTTNHIYVAGTTQGRTGFATTDAFQTDLFAINYGSGDLYNQEVFLAKFNDVGLRDWGTYYGNAAGNTITALACDKIGHVYIAGSTSNPDPNPTLSQMYTANGYQTSWSGGYYFDAYIARFNAAGKRQWASLWGGNGDDYITGIAFNAGHVMYIAGSTASSNNIATAGSHQPVYGGLPLDDFSISQDAYLSKFNDCFTVAPPAAINGATAVCAGSVQTYSVPASSCATSYKWQLPPGWTGSSTTGSITVSANTNGGTISVIANGVNDTSYATTMAVTVNPVPVVTITPAGLTLKATSGYDGYQWLRNNQPVTGANAVTYTVAASGNYAVVATNDKSCKDTSDLYAVKLNTNLFVPNMFSPNGDANNDVLKVYGNQLATLDFMVFNQWGQKVYESHDINGGWDGRCNGKPQPVGVYMYTLRVTVTGGEEIQQKGAISLVR